MEKLAKRLRELRKEKNMTQEELAQVLGFSTNGYQRYELDERDPVAPAIVSMADFFQVSADYLLGRSDKR